MRCNHAQSVTKITSDVAKTFAARSRSDRRESANYAKLEETHMLMNLKPLEQHQGQEKP
jgi:hypothetical protein